MSSGTPPCWNCDDVRWKSDTIATRVGRKHAPKNKLVNKHATLLHYAMKRKLLKEERPLSSRWRRLNGRYDDRRVHPSTVPLTTAPHPVVVVVVVRYALVTGSRTWRRPTRPPFVTGRFPAPDLPDRRLLVSLCLFVSWSVASLRQHRTYQWLLHRRFLNDLLFLGHELQ